MPFRHSLVLSQWYQKQLPCVFTTTIAKPKIFNGAEDERGVGFHSRRGLWFASASSKLRECFRRKKNLADTGFGQLDLLRYGRMGRCGERLLCT